MQTLVSAAIPSFWVLFWLSIFVDGCERGLGRGQAVRRTGSRSHPSTKIESMTGLVYVDISTINGRNHYSHRCLDASTILAWNHYSQRCLHDIYYKWPWNHCSQRCLHDLLPPQRLTPKRGITTAIDVCTTYYHLNDLDRAIVPGRSLCIVSNALRGGVSTYKGSVHL